MSDQWTPAELIPTAGIRGTQEQERRATSALLAVLGAVNEYGRTVTRALGAPAGRIETFIEVPFELNGKRWTPDGLIRVTRGATTWCMLVETKTSTNRLETPQLEAYLDVARQEGFNGLLTISNEVPPIFGAHPTVIDKRKLRGNLQLRHLSWTWLLTEAVVQRLHRGVSDRDQAWILGELIRYLEHPRSGVVEFDDMGDAWTTVRDAVRAGTLRANDRGAADVAGRWDQLIRYSCLYLGRHLGADVQPVLTRQEREALSIRAQRLRHLLETEGCLEGGLRIVGAVGPITVRADLRARQLSTSVRIEAPRTGRPRTRVNWLLRQIPDAPGSLRIDADVFHGRSAGASALLDAVRKNPDVLIEDSRRELKSFTISMVVPMGTGRSRGRSSFVDSVLDSIDAFYSSVVQNLKEWSPPAPRMPARTDVELPEDEPVEAAVAEDEIELPEAGDSAAVVAGDGAGPPPFSFDPNAEDAAMNAGVDGQPTNQDVYGSPTSN